MVYAEIINIQSEVKSTMGLPMADEDKDKNVPSENNNHESNLHASREPLGEVRNENVQNVLNESNRRHSLPPVFPDNVNVQRLCGQILRVMGDEHFSKTCGRHLRCMGDEMCSYYWVRNQMLRSEQPPMLRSNSHSLPDLTHHPKTDKS